MVFTIKLYNPTTSEWLQTLPERAENAEVRAENAEAELEKALEEIIRLRGK